MAAAPGLGFLGGAGIVDANGFFSAGAIQATTPLTGAPVVDRPPVVDAYSPSLRLDQIAYLANFVRSTTWGHRLTVPA